MKEKYILLLFIIPFFASAQIKINELMSNNVSYVMDDSYNYSMWVELYNPSALSSVNQSNFYFSDDKKDLKKWKPAPKSISAKSYSLLWFEREDRSGHCSFKLKPEGGKLYLVNSSSLIIDSVKYPPQYRNISFGRKSDESNVWVFFEKPSPGLSNNDKQFATQRCIKPVFSLLNGFYKNSQVLKFNNTSVGDSIRYTTNGSEPTKYSNLYISGSTINIGSTTIIRAKTFSFGKLSSDIATSTYFINQRNTHLPIVSIVTENANLKDNTIGIYVTGTNGIIGNGMNVPANWNQDWDRPANFELFDTTGTSRLNQELDIAIAGNWTRMNPQKSLKISPRKKYGDGQLRYDIFSKTKPGREYKDIQLRNSGNDFYYSMMRDALMSSLIIRRMDIDYLAYEPAVLFINGLYYGLQNLRERSSKDYLFSNYGLEDDEFHLIESWEMPYDTSYLPLSNYISSNDITKEATYNKVCEMMDVDNFINYMISEIYYGNTDWPHNNLKIWKKKNGGKWRWILFDTDFGFNLYNLSLHSHNSLLYALGEKSGEIPQAWSTLLLRRLILNEVFRKKFIDRFCVQLSTTFATNRVNHVMDSIAVKISAEMVYHKSKWTSYRTFATDLTNMKNFSSYRPANMMGFLSSRFMNSVPINTIKITSNVPGTTYLFNSEPVLDKDAKISYFKNKQIELKANSVAGYKFKHWATASNVSQVYTTPLFTGNLTGNIDLIAIFEKSDEEPINDNPVYINEIVSSNSKFPDEYGDKDDYIEIYNNGNQSIDIGGWFLSDALFNPTKVQIPITDPSITTIPAKGRIVFWADNEPHQGVLHIGLKLDKDGETLLLSKKNFSNFPVIVDSVTFPAFNADMSYSRTYDGSSVWIVQTPTINCSNLLTGSELNVVSQVFIYPTIVTESFTVLNASGKGLVITDLTGKALYRSACQSDSETIYTNDLKKGMYFVTVGHHTIKIVKK